MEVHVVEIGVERNPEDQYAKLGEDAVFTCVYTVNNDMVISSINWFKDSSAIALSIGIEDDEKAVLSRKSSLTLTNVSAFMQGAQCSILYCTRYA